MNIEHRTLNAELRSFAMVCALMVGCLAVQGWTVTGLVERVNFTSSAKVITIAPVSSPLVNGAGTTFQSETISITPTAGAWRHELEAGYYNVTFGTARDVYRIQVPPGSGTNNFWELATNVVVLTTNMGGPFVTYPVLNTTTQALWQAIAEGGGAGGTGEVSLITFQSWTNSSGLRMTAADSTNAAQQTAVAGLTNRAANAELTNAAQQTALAALTNRAVNAELTNAANTAAAVGLTNLDAGKQTGSMTLSNLVGTGVITNVVNGSTNGTGWIGIIKSTNNGNVVLKTFTASGAITLTDQVTNIDISTSGAAGEANVNGEAGKTNATYVGVVAGKAGITNLLRSFSPGLYLVVTNEGTNVVFAIDWSTLTNGILGLLSNGVPLITTDGLVFNYLTVSNWAKFVGPVTNTGIVVMTGLPGTGTNLTVDASGNLRLASLPVGGTGSAAWNETNIVISATNNVLWDVAAFDRAVIKAITNLNLLVLSNVASMTKKAHLIWQADSNGTRTVRFAVAGGRFETNGLTEPTTNANKQTILEVTQSGFPTNAAVSGFVTNITAEPFTNSLASGGGGGGGPSYLLEENFQGSASGGCFDLSSWTVTGSIDSCYPGNLTGQSLRLTGDGTGATHTFTAGAERYFYWRMYITTAASERYAMIIQDAAGANNLAFVSINAGAFKIYDVGLSHSASIATGYSTGTELHCWLHVNKGTGADGVIDFGFSTTGVRPTSGGTFGSIANANVTTDANIVAPFNSGGSADFQIDTIKVSTTVIGDNP